MAERVITRLGDNAFLVTDADGTRRRAWAVADGRSTWVFVDGRTWRIEPDRPRAQGATSTHATDDVALASPMPATVSAVKVQVGERVSQGDVLVTLEAMKMELPIRAPRDGVVRSIACTTGELVQPGVQLIALD